MNRFSHIYDVYVNELTFNKQFMIYCFFKKYIIFILGNGKIF